MTPANQALTRAALDSIEAACDLTFVPRTDEDDYLHFRISTLPGNFASNHGYAPGRTRIEITNWLHWTIVHEVLHAMGMEHEMAHPDRDGHIRVNLQHIPAVGVPSFGALPGHVFLTWPYDFPSVLHYGQFHFSSGGGRTISVRAPFQRRWQHAMTAVPANRLSAGDAWTLTTLYGGDPPPLYFEMATPTRGGIVGVGWTPSFTWEAAQLADTYRLLVDDDPDFGSPEIDAVTAANSYNHGIPLDDDTVYYWTVSATNSVGTTNAYPLDRYAFYTGAGIPTVLHVDDNAAPGGTGGSWGDALESLRKACVFAAEIDAGVTEIRVAGGTYTPDDGTGVRARSFDLESGVTFLGGYAGIGAADPDMRDPQLYETVLSGDLAGDDTPGVFTSNRSDNAYHSMRLIGLTGVVIDGVTFSGGNANGPTLADQFGGGLAVDECEITITDCEFRDNIASSTAAGGAGLALVYETTAIVAGCLFENNFDAAWGGGAIATHTIADVSIRECQFLNNVTGPGGWGGATFHQGKAPVFERCVFDGNIGFNGGAVGAWTNADPTFINCVFQNNGAAGAGGGAGGAILANTSSSISAHGCAFIDNTAGFAGAAIRVSSTSTAELINCSLVGNMPGASGPAIAADGTSSVTVANSVLWGNGLPTIAGAATVSYSDVQGGFAGTANINLDPAFVDLAGRDLRPDAGSPLIDAGDNTQTPIALTADLDGNPRLADDPDTADSGNGTAPIIDLGVYERQTAVCLADLNGDGVLNVDDIDVFVAAFLGGNLAADLDGNGTLNVDDIDAFVAAFIAGCP